MPESDTRFHPAVAAIYDPIQVYFERYQAPAHRRYLATGLDGDVLEIAMGTGAMLPYFEEAATQATVHGLEPDPGMYERARQKFADRSLDVRLVQGRAEDLPYADDTFDYVVESGLFCSVPDVEGALDEIARVLAPGGEFRFFDHVRSTGLVGRTQDALTPLWRRVGGNCHLNRRLSPAIGACEGLSVVERDRLPVGHWPIREFLRGRATVDAK